MMNARQFYDWQTSGGADDVLRLVDCLERAGTCPLSFSLKMCR